ncbi:MAG: hypothetical protein KatS3mg027_0823 [Bacteroidia bacterium]|nr:MAG: hypothetical protein KatS3mg027_0823 [Bacteroidia bacterium]
MYPIFGNRKKHILKSFLRFFIYTQIIFIFNKCAQIVPLTGGQKDTTPPILENTLPSNFSTHFNSSIIKFNFNEKIQLINPNDNIILVPFTPQPLQWKVKNKTLEIIVPENLDTNVTYKIIFNKCIADLTEKNTIDYLEYVFSKQNYIDSFYIKGKVKNAWTLEAEKNVLVALYKPSANDSIILKEKPLYFAKSDEQGLFKLKHLPDAPFKIFVFTDNNNNLLYDPYKEKIDTKNTPIYTRKDSSLIFYVSSERPIKNYLKKIQLLNNSFIHLIYTFPDYYRIKHSNTNAHIINDSLPSDTCKILMSRVDTASFIIQTSSHIDTIVIPFSSNKKTTYNYTLLNLHNNVLNYDSPIILQPNYWLDTTRLLNNILLFTKNDTIHPLNIQSYSVVMPYRISINYLLQQNTEYILKIPINTANQKDSLSYQTIGFKTNAIENLAQLKVNILFPEKKNYLVTLCNTQHKVIYVKKINLPIAASNQQSIEFKNILPDTYLLKIIQDDNQNNQWDTHRFLLNTDKREFAEKVFIYPKPIKLINNWDVVLDWNEVK